MAALAALALGVGFAGVGASAAQAEGTGIVSGTVTSGGSPVSGVTVTLSGCNGDYCDTNPSNTLTTTTDASGAYSFTDLDPKEYTLHFQPGAANPNIAAVYWGGTVSSTSAARVTVADGATTDGSIALPAGGRITGTITGAGSVNLSNVLAQVFYCDPNYDPQRQFDCWTLLYHPGVNAYSNASGVYTLTNLLAGQYRVVFHPQSNNAQYAYEYWNNARTFGAATAVTVTAGAATTVSPQLDVGASISGTVRDSANNPVVGATVGATNTADSSSTANATVQADGTYSFQGLQPGEYYLRATPPSGSVLTGEYWDNKLDAATATRFTVPLGGSHTANFQLANGGMISGNVKNNASTPANLPNIKVDLMRLQNGFWSTAKSTTTNASGNYAFDGIDNGQYVVRFSDFGGSYGQRYLGNTADRTAATVFTIAAGDNLTSRNITLASGGTLSGTITQKPTGQAAVPSADSGYELFRLGAGGVAESLSFNFQTDASGQFSMTGLAPGSYIVRAYGSGTTSWAWEYAGGYYQDEATQFAVTSGGTTTGADVEVVPGTTISGYFTDTNFQPVPSVRVNILHERSPGNWVTPPPSGGSGDVNFYRVSGLPPGNYKVSFIDSATTNPYVTQWYSNKPTEGTATVFGSPNGGSFTDITARMTRDPWPALDATATASPASPNGSAGWYKSGTITVSFAATGGTDVPNTFQYKVNGASTWTTGSSATVSTNGTTVITYRAVESGLQNSAEKTLTIKRDTIAPTVSSSLSGRTLTISSADTGSSGVASTQYRIAPSTTWVDYAGPVAVGNSAVTVEYRATDAAGNVSTTGSREVPAAVGTVSVTTTATPAAPDGANGWYKTTVSVTGSGTSSLGGAVTVESKVGSGSYTEVATRSVTTDGTTVLTFRGEDAFGNVSSAVTRTIKLDKVAPTVSSTISGRTVTISGSDATSGVASIQYRVAPSTTWITYTLPVQVAGAAAATVEFRATDKAGHVSTTGTRAVPAAPPVDLPVPDRIEGSDRFETANDAALASYPAGADVVYVTTGMLFPDALSAGPAAAHEGGPLLLVPGTSLPASVVDTIEELDPARIIVIGGTPSVSATVFTQLKALVPNTTRISGADRFATSRSVTAAAFDSAEVAYIATGLNFPDALAAGGAAGVNEAPVILVNGGATSLDAATRTLLQDLGVTQVKVLGGTGSVSAGVYSGLSSLLGASNVERLAGADRFETARIVNEDAFLDGPGANQVFLATGLNFPDALAGSAWAAKNSAPLYTVMQNCVPPLILADIEDLHPSDIVLLGGTPSLGTGVKNLTPCN